jgi:hypothetical protein
MIRDGEVEVHVPVRRVARSELLQQLKGLINTTQRIVHCSKIEDGCGIVRSELHRGFEVLQSLGALSAQVIGRAEVDAGGGVVLVQGHSRCEKLNGLVETALAERTSSPTK